MFINFSNHPSAGWCRAQREAAEAFGEICDLPFPDVSPMATTEEVARMAERSFLEILRKQPACVMCQGEFTLSVAVIRRLQEAGIRCVCACTERKAVEKRQEDGSIQKLSVFEFRQFREYEKGKSECYECF